MTNQGTTVIKIILNKFRRRADKYSRAWEETRQKEYKNMTSWKVYLLYNKAANRTYIGASTDPERRLREHNSGKGARATRACLGYGDWLLVAHLEGFESKSGAYSIEKLLKLHHKGLHNRYDAFRALSEGVFCKRGVDVSEQYSIPKLGLKDY